MSQAQALKSEKAKVISSNYSSNCIKNATAKKQIPIASFIPIDTDVAAAKSNNRFIPCKQRINTKTLELFGVETGTKEDK